MGDCKWRTAQKFLNWSETDRDGFKKPSECDIVSIRRNRVDGMKAPAVFLRFVGSLTPDAALEKQAKALTEQMFRARTMEAQGYAQQARMMQMQAMQRQMEVSRQIARDSAEISDGIMDSWEKRNASQSRTSTAWSEAVRGVNTYAAPSGKTVEFDVTADHVYQNRYGDSIGVSGCAVDPDVAAALDWTELNRK